MEANPLPYSSPPTEEGSVRAADHSWLGVLIETVDRGLRHRQGVSEYTRSCDCLFRMQIICNKNDLLLKDGTCLRPGDRVINLHFWNDQVPLIPARGPTLGWARRMKEGCALSLQELARHLAGRTDMDDVVAVRANVALGAAARSGKISRILSRFGFEIVPQQDSPSLAQRFNQYSENIFVSLMVLGRNAVALRRDTLVRDRVVAYLSRQTLEQRYGAGAKTAFRTSS